MQAVRVSCALVLAVALAAPDEGMWLFNQFPSGRVRAKYGFEVTGGFLDHLRLASVRLSSGGSGSFVSPRGLIFTNHHVASDCIQKIGSAGHDYLREGFYAPGESQEVRCPDLEADVLVSVETVTRRVDAGTAQANPSEANRRRQESIASIEKECTVQGGGRCEVVPLFSGGRYDLYRYKRYGDVRLVFAPEFAIAAFGGDPDNFTYPRYDLDVSFLRAYEAGRPAATDNYLHWSREGVRDGDLVFVAGNPAGTSRLDTVAQLEYERDEVDPFYLERLGARIRLLKDYSARGEENRRVAGELQFSFENDYKEVTGELEGLRDPRLMERKRAEERKLREAVEPSSRPRGETDWVWEQVAAAYREFAPYAKRYSLLESGPMGSALFRIARWCLRLPEEKTRPNGARLREYREASLPPLEERLYSTAPITDSLEIAILTQYLREMRQYPGVDDPTVKAALGGRSPEEAAAGYVQSSRLKEVAERRRLAGHLEAVRASDDGMVRLVRLLDGPAREVRRKREDTIEAVATPATGRIARARLALYGKEEYPDATFTPRVAYGQVRGYRDRAGNPLAFATDFAGLYRRATGRDPYRLPERWEGGKSSLDLATPLNFVSTADISGGNSGSPTVNRRSELVGIVFDGNLESLPNAFFYDDTRARAIHVASQGIVEALRKLYHTDALLKELLR